MSDLIDPSSFPVPETLTYALDAVAAKLKTDGTDLTDTAADITGAWAGLEGIYSAPEDQDLFTVLNPLTGNGDDVSTALSSTSDALSDFAETVRDIKARWATLKADSYAFLNKIEGDDDWRDGGGFLWWKTESEEVGEHNALHDRAAGLLFEFEEAERTCANAITGLFGGTRFVAQKADGSVTAGDGEFVYGFDAPLEGVAMEWGAPQTTDHAWYNDLGDAVGDFFVGIAEDAGGMVGAHGPDGWFAGNWGDNLWEYWGGTVEGLGALVGVGKDENGDWGWSLDTAGNAWKEAAHAVVPWEEWGERPWYVIGTAALNIGAMVGGALLTATGVGAVVGVPLMAWRGAKIANAVGGSRTPDVPDLADFPGGIDPSLLSRIPRFGDGSFKPLDLSDVEGLDISAADLGRMNEALERLNTSTTDLPDGSDGRRTTDTGSGGESGSIPRGTTANGSDTQTENNNRRNGDSDETVDPTADQLDAGQEFLDGIDPESRRALDEGLDGELDDWVASQEVPDDISSVNDTPVQHYETEPSQVEADTEQRVEVDSAGNEINGRHDTTVNNSAGGTGTLDTPRGGTTVVDVDSGSGRGGSTGGGGGGGGNGGGGGGGLPDGPDDLPPDIDTDPDATDTSGTDSGWVGDRPKNGSGLTNEQRIRLAGSHLDGLDMSSPEAFQNDFVERLNNSSELRGTFYRSDGHRWSADDTIGTQGYELPKITWNSETGRWDVTPEAEKPTYLGDATDVRLNSPDADLPEGLREALGDLDWLAEQRRLSIDSAAAAHERLKAMEQKHGEYNDNGPNHPELEEAKRNYRAAQDYSTKICEAFGEETAKVGARFEFNGDVIRDANGDPLMREVTDADGNTTLEEFRPNLEGAELLPTADKAPLNGNNQFDQIYRTADGDIVIIEAKSSTNTELGSRRLPGNPPRRVSQGHLDYFEDILREMRKRGESGNLNEAALADEIERKLEQGRVAYAVFKGNPSDTYINDSDVSGYDPTEGNGQGWNGSTADGYRYRLFDLRGQG
ncbi:hypothetical protein [Nocardiopsis sp. CC223A]|uniref:hypothetical protein n=1 Tax=Nocardiopsis sp. CC223A TaxID=3044051 RepID=UPI00278C57EB|nr:hypothetical protein [Nocardiopsis sp. CC223A]